MEYQKIINSLTACISSNARDCNQCVYFNHNKELGAPCHLLLMRRALTCILQLLAKNEDLLLYSISLEADIDEHKTK